MQKVVMLKSGKEIFGDIETLDDVLKLRDITTAEELELLVDGFTETLDEVIEFEFNVYPISRGSKQIFIPMENIDYIVIDGAKEFIDSVHSFADQKGWI